jgi:ribosomal protein S18 acetylase RimI-like enzyme
MVDDVLYRSADARLVVEPVPATDWKKVRDLRLEALASDPDRFLPGSVEEEAAADADAYWVDSFRDGTWVVARWGDQDVGLAHLRPDSSGSRVWHVEKVWVHGEFRRRGVASEMMLRLIADVPDHGKILLWIMEDNAPARELYTNRFDFKPTGERQATQANGRSEVRLVLGRRRSIWRSLANLFAGNRSRRYQAIGEARGNRMLPHGR